MSISVHRTTKDFITVIADDFTLATLSIERATALRDQLTNALKLPLSPPATTSP